MNNEQKKFGELYEVKQGAFKGCLVIPWKAYNHMYDEDSLCECLICYDPSKIPGVWFFANINLAQSNLKSL